MKNGRRPQKKQSTKINLIGCDTIVNSPSPSSSEISVLMSSVVMWSWVPGGLRVSSWTKPSLVSDV